MNREIPKNHYDLICVGGGIMSANLALMAKMLKPDLSILILERLGDVAQESSAAWNNAGTGHSALCELNYCPEQEDGSVSIKKAIEICKQFEITKQFWAHLVEKGFIEDPQRFLKPIPHHSWVTGEKNVTFLKKRFEAFKEHFMFDTIEYTDQISKMRDWFPLIMHDRTEDEVMAGSRIDRGTEVNFGVLTKRLYEILATAFDTPVHFHKEVEDLDPLENGNWTAITKDLKTGKKQSIEADHIFIGAGGGALLLLETVEIEEKDGFGGFPVSGGWLVCKNKELIEQHNAKVYSKAGEGAPPMSMPHLDTRYVDGEKQLMFGPFAGFSPKFLKQGSNLDLVKSVNFKNIPSMLGAFWHNLDLTKYLIGQVTMTFDDRMNELRNFIKDAKNEDWRIEVAGQRVQTIKRDEFKGGKLEFGTQIVSGSDGKITCLLGASPGASTAPKIMLDVLEQAFPEIMNSPEGKKKLKEIVPSYKEEITKEHFNKELQRTTSILNL
ncbi:malate dehydrogenase (quinone) [Dokdonia donghaensis]|uniref:malate dehydrogenase (quinone) n=1 Tax=Dokdonia donghaensis TaxID=326320 RepID=UPI0035C86337